MILNINYLRGNERIVVIIIILILFIYGNYYNYKHNQYNITVGKNGHLIWHWIDIEYLNIISLFFYLYPVLRNGEYLLFILLSLSIIYSVYNYYYCLVY